MKKSGIALISDMINGKVKNKERFISEYDGVRIEIMYEDGKFWLMPQRYFMDWDKDTLCLNWEKNMQTPELTAWEIETLRNAYKKGFRWIAREWWLDGDGKFKKEKKPVFLHSNRPKIEEIGYEVFWESDGETHELLFGFDFVDIYDPIEIKTLAKPKA